jgi:hypothetical protein
MSMTSRRFQCLAYLVVQLLGLGMQVTAGGIEARVSG